jgi:hypothetical protein
LMPEGEEQHFFTHFGVLQTDAARRRIRSVDDTSFDATAPQLIVRRVLNLGKLVGGQAGDAVVHEISTSVIEVFESPLRRSTQQSVSCAGIASHAISSCEA